MYYNQFRDGLGMPRVKYMHYQDVGVKEYLLANENTLDPITGPLLYVEKPSNQLIDGAEGIYFVSGHPCSDTVIILNDLTV